MIEILPNWHPIFVHFTVALFATAALLFLAAAAFAGRGWAGAARTAARWNLWLGAALTVGTVAAGIYAFNTVAHDDAAHAAMTDHRNWALATASLWWVLALWAAWQARVGRRSGGPFLVVAVVALGLLAVTAFKGGELVYRHGLGVLSLPEAGAADDHRDAAGDHHDAAEDHHDGGGHTH